MTVVGGLNSMVLGTFVFVCLFSSLKRNLGASMSLMESGFNL